MSKLPVLLVASALLTAACGATTISGSSVKSVRTMAGSNAVEAADGATRSAATPQVQSHWLVPVDHPAGQPPLTPVLKPAAPLPAADGAAPALSCQGLSGPGKPKVMCAPQ